MATLSQSRHDLLLVCGQWIIPLLVGQTDYVVKALAGHINPNFTRILTILKAALMYNFRAVKRQWLDLLHDPIDHSALHFENITESDGEDIIAAEIKSASGHTYPVKMGIPSFVSGATQTTDSVSSFEFEWNSFGFSYAKTGWLEDLVKPLVGSESYFKDKVIVDAGAGSGSQSAWMASAGAKLVMSLELSNGIYDMHHKTVAPYKENVFPIQCDIAMLPIKQTPDLLYCMNVIQHTASIKRTFKGLCDILGQNSTFMFNVYTQKQSTGLIKALRSVTTRLPFQLVYWVSFLAACVVYPAMLLKIISIRSFKEIWLDIYDLLGPHHYQDYMSEQQQLEMIKGEGLKVLKQEKFGYLLAKN